MKHSKLLSFLVFVLMASPCALAQVEFLGMTRLAGVVKDSSNLTGELEGGVAINHFGGISAIDYAGANNEYWALSDRGAGDGAVSYPCRVHRIMITVDPKSKSVRSEIVGCSLLRNQAGQSITGSEARMLEWSGEGRCPSYDPEGVRQTPNQELIVCDEYGPFIDLFHADGRLLREFPVPEKFGLGTRRKPPFQRGAFTNRGLEGIALSPDGNRFIAAMQGPLIQDGRIDAGKCLGTQTRWLIGDLKSSKTVEVCYPLTDESTGVSEVLAVDSDRYLVIERDSAVGAAAKIKHIYLADLRGVTNVSDVESLISESASAVRSVRKSLLIDLLDPSYGLSGEQSPGKPEGLAWGPDLEDGRRLLIVAYDNDFREDADTIFVAFAVEMMK